MSYDVKNTAKAGNKRASTCNKSKSMPYQLQSNTGLICRKELNETKTRFNQQIEKIESKASSQKVNQVQNSAKGVLPKIGIYTASTTSSSSVQGSLNTLNNENLININSQKHKNANLGTSLDEQNCINIFSIRSQFPQFQSNSVKQMGKNMACNSSNNESNNIYLNGSPLQILSSKVIQKNIEKKIQKDKQMDFSNSSQDKQDQQILYHFNTQSSVSTQFQNQNLTNIQCKRSSLEDCSEGTQMQQSVIQEANSNKSIHLQAQNVKQNIVNDYFKVDNQNQCKVINTDKLIVVPPTSSPDQQITQQRYQRPLIQKVKQSQSTINLMPFSKETKSKTPGLAIQLSNNIHPSPLQRNFKKVGQQQKKVDIVVAVMPNSAAYQLQQQTQQQGSEVQKIYKKVAPDKQKEMFINLKKKSLKRENNQLNSSLFLEMQQPGLLDCKLSFQQKDSFSQNQLEAVIEFGAYQQQQLQQQQSMQKKQPNALSFTTQFEVNLIKSVKQQQDFEFQKIWIQVFQLTQQDVLYISGKSLINNRQQIFMIFEFSDAELVTLNFKNLLMTIYINQKFSKNRENCPTIIIYSQPQIFQPNQIDQVLLTEVEQFQTLNNFIIQNKYKSFTEDQVVSFYYQILSALSELQQLGFCHCNLNLQTIIYCAHSQRFKIKDLHYCYPYSAQCKQQMQPVFSQPPFRAPEIESLDQFGSYDLLLSDMYSLGVCFLCIKTQMTEREAQNPAIFEEKQKKVQADNTFSSQIIMSFMDKDISQRILNSYANCSRHITHYLVKKEIFLSSQKFNDKNFMIKRTDPFDLKSVQSSSEDPEDIMQLYCKILQWKSAMDLYFEQLSEKKVSQKTMELLIQCMVRLSKYENVSQIQQWNYQDLEYNLILAMYNWQDISKRSWGITYMQKAIEYIIQQRGEEDFQAITLMNNLALMYVQLQLYDRAQQQLINVINILKVQDNIYSELYVIALENLAYINIKELQHAIELEKKVQHLSSRIEAWISLQQQLESEILKSNGNPPKKAD